MQISKKTFQRLIQFVSDVTTPEQVATYLLIRYIDFHPIPSRTTITIPISPEVERAIGKYVLSRYGNTIIKRMLDYLEAEIRKGGCHEEKDEEYY